MAYPRLARTVIKDVPFVLLNSPGGSMTDDKDWADGLTSPQWPTVEFWTAAGGTGIDKTSLFAYDITLTTITSATHKHPTGTTGIWRKAQGRYRIRVQPSAGLAFADYYMRVEFEPGTSSTYAEDYIVTVISPGDITFSDVVFESVEVEEIRRGINTVLTDDQISDLILESSVWAQGYLQAFCGIDPESFEELPPVIRLAIIMYTRWLISVYDVSAGGLAGITEIAEGTERIKFGGRSDSAIASMEGRAERLLGAYCKQNSPGRRPSIGAVTKMVGHTVNDGGLANEETYY